MDGVVVVVRLGRLRRVQVEHAQRLFQFVAEHVGRAYVVFARTGFRFGGFDRERRRPVVLFGVLSGSGGGFQVRFGIGADVERDVAARRVRHARERNLPPEFHARFPQAHFGMTRREDLQRVPPARGVVVDHFEILAARPLARAFVQQTLAFVLDLVHLVLQQVQLVQALLEWAREAVERLRELVANVRAAVSEIATVRLEQRVDVRAAFRHPEPARLDDIGAAVVHVARQALLLEQQRLDVRAAARDALALLRRVDDDRGRTAERFRQPPTRRDFPDVRSVLDRLARGFRKQVADFVREVVIRQGLS